MNKILTFMVCLLSLTGRSQIQIMLYPVQGLELKPAAMFSATVQNQDVQSGKFYFVGTITNRTTGERMVSARSAVVDIQPGVTALSESMLSPDYQVMSSVVSQNGVFPYGVYRVCVSVYRVNIIEPVADDCQEAEITPLSPPLLLSPEHQSTITQEQPLLVWLPPMPVMKDVVLYDLKLVEILPNQTPYDAIQRNFAVMEQQNITGTTLQYPMNASKLEEGKKYAWKVTAKTGAGKPIGETEVWWFVVGRAEATATTATIYNTNYIKMKKEVQSDYTYVSNELRVIFNKEYEVKNLVFRIKTPDGGLLADIGPETIRYEGNNKYLIDLSTYKKIKQNGVYILEALSKATGESQYFSFKYKH